MKHWHRRLAILFTLLLAIMPARAETLDAENLDQYARKMALQTWDAEAAEKDLQERLRSAFDEAFIGMGIRDDRVRGELFRYTARQTDFGTLLVSAQDGNLGRFAGACGKLAGDAVIAACYSDRNLIKNLTKMGGAAITGITNAALALSEGEGARAGKELSIAFINYFPTGKAILAAVEVAHAAIGSWKDDQLASAYQQFTQLLPAGGESLSPDDWTDLSIRIDPYIRQLQSEQKDAWCRVNGISRAQLDADAALSGRLERLTSENLRKKFEDRARAEGELEARTESCREIILGFDRDGLLTQGSFGFDFGGDLEDRLVSLNRIRTGILLMVGGKMPCQMGEDPARNLNAAIAEWLVRGPEDRAGFYEWMAVKGYIAPPEPQTEMEAILDAFDPDAWDVLEGPDWLTEDITDVPEVPGN
ncbi:MAG: hypothetical protein AB9880_08930 [Christensenellales bacterium]